MKRVLLATLGLGLWGCQASTVPFAGRPCSDSEPCGGGLLCDPVKKVCVEGGPGSDGRPDRLLLDAPRESSIARDAPGDGVQADRGTRDRSPADGVPPDRPACSPPCASGLDCIAGTCTCVPGGSCSGCCNGNVCIAPASQQVQLCGLKGLACASCVDSNPCTTEACASGTCKITAVLDGTPCPGGSCKSGGCNGCAPSCGGKQCGPDGCGGSCGGCTTPPKTTCNASGQCICVPSCGGKQCGPDGCGGSCGGCTTPPNTTCNASGVCVCTPACGGKNCGPDGCGGDCGSCGTGSYCASGTCSACPTCASLGYYTGSLRGCTFDGSNGCWCGGADGNSNNSCDPGESCWGSDNCSSGNHNPANCTTKKNISVPAGCTAPAYCFECS